MQHVTLTVNLKGPEPRNPVSVFHLGQGFFLAGSRCLLNIDVGPGVVQCLISPAVVNLCLAIELFLKSIVLHAGALPPKSHKLSQLSKLVPADFLETLRVSYEQGVSSPTLGELLAQVDDYFVKVRYGHEFNVFAFHEHPVYVLARCLYMQVASCLGQRTGLQTVQV